MNILITLPKPLIDCIISGEKTFEMRKTIPRKMVLHLDGFFVVEKGTADVRCWCRVDDVCETVICNHTASSYSSHLCVDEEYIMKYARNKKVYLWKIGKVVVLSDVERNSLFVNRNPQQFAYCPFSYGQSY